MSLNQTKSLYTQVIDKVIRSLQTDMKINLGKN